MLTEKEGVGNYLFVRAQGWVPAHTNGNISGDATSRLDHTTNLGMDISQVCESNVLHQHCFEW